MPKTLFFHSCVGVFQGGGCRAAALVGAYEEAVARSVQFTEFAGTSAGSIIAVLVGAGATPVQLTKFVRDLDFRKFLTPPDEQISPPWYISLLPKKYRPLVDLFFNQGFYSSKKIEDWIEECLTELLGPRQGPIPFSALPYQTSVVASDILSRKARVWNQSLTPTESVAKAVRASCSIPIFFQPVDRQFVDGGALSNLPSFVFSNGAAGRPLTSKILAFVLQGDPETINSWGTKSYLSAVVNTMVDGAQQLQQQLQPEVYTIEIPTGEVKATDFDTMSPEILDRLIQGGKNAASEFFNTELTRVRRQKSSNILCRDKEELYNNITFHLNETVDEIIITDFNTKFAYEIFPSLLIWRLRGVSIKVAVPESELEKDHGIYRRRLLRKLGIELTEHAEIPVRSFLINSHDPQRGTAYVALPTSSQDSIQATIYEGSLHSTAIDAIRSRLLGLVVSPPKESDPTRPRMEPGSLDSLVAHLKTVQQYSKPGVQISLEQIPLNKLVALASYVHEYKYRQFEHWIPEFNKQGIDLFQAAQIRYSDSDAATSIITPPVVEKSGDQYILIEGSTRAVYLRDQGHKEMTCVVVKNTKDALPGKPTSFAHVRIIGRRIDTSERYDGFNYSNFRNIERATHPLDSWA